MEGLSKEQGKSNKKYLFKSCIIPLLATNLSCILLNSKLIITNQTIYIMKILLLNGNAQCENESFNQYITDLKSELINAGAEVELLKLNDLNIQFCSGCWSCWWKTPGLCMFKDDMVEIYKKVLNVELVLFATPLVKGYETALTKKVKERLIPLLHPDMEIRNNQCHHLKRYAKYPDMGFIYEKEIDTDAMDEKILYDIQKRYVLNFHASVKIFEPTTKPLNEITHAIINN